jgi:fatty acid hydroxylase domain-containing protein 2
LEEDEAQRKRRRYEAYLILVANPKHSHPLLNLRQLFLFFWEISQGKAGDIASGLGLVLRQRIACSGESFSSLTPLFSLSGKYSSMAKGSTALKVVSALLFVMLAVKLLAPWLVEWLSQAWVEFCHGKSEETMILIGFGIFFASYWITGLLYLYTDLNHRPEAIWKAKLQPKREFLIHGGPFNPSLKATIVNALSNQVFVFLPGMFLLHFGSKQLGLGLVFSPQLPSFQTVAVTAIKLILAVEIGFYYSHRFLHLKLLYRFHKTHHSYVTPIALSAIYSSPVEAFLSSVCCIIGPAFFLQSHVVIFFLGLAVGWITTCRAHSGYAEIRHDLHHSKNKGNFGLLGLLDYLHGTAI